MLNFGNNLRNIRVQRGLTQTYMAKSIGLTIAAYRFYEIGEREPNLSNLKKIAQILSVSIDDLLGENEKDDDFEKAKKLWSAYDYRIEEDIINGIEIYFNEIVEKVVVDKGNVERKIYNVVSLSTKDEFVKLTHEVEESVSKKAETARKEIFRNIVENSKPKNFVIEEKGTKSYYVEKVPTNENIS